MLQPKPLFVERMKTLLEDYDAFYEISGKELTRSIRCNTLKISPEELKRKVSKKLLGKFKKEIWSLPQKNRDKICEELGEKFIFFFKALNVSGTKDLIARVYS